MHVKIESLKVQEKMDDEKYNCKYRILKQFQSYLEIKLRSRKI